MPLPFRFLRRVCRCSERRLGARTDVEASTPKEGSLQADVSSPNQAEAEYFTFYPNQWAKIRLVYCPNWRYNREAIREPAAEMLDTMIFILVGTGVNCQFALSADVNLFLSLRAVTSVLTSLGIAVCGKVTGPFLYSFFSC